MNLIQKFKSWRDRRFQKRVLKALGAEIIDGKDRAIIFDRDVVSKYDIQSFDKVPVINNDEIHEHDGGVPV